MCIRDSTLGETTIPARPERIVAGTDFVDLDYLLTLGIDPVLFGFSNAWESGAMPWQSAAADLPTFDASADLDLEAIAAAHPDLILTMPMMVGFQYGDAFYIWGEESGGGAIFQELGLDFIGGADPVLQQTSLEQVSLLAPAEILLSVDSDPAGIALQEASPSSGPCRRSSAVAMA